MSSNKYSFLERYGQTILKNGIAAIPFSLFNCQKELGLGPEEVWFISYVLSFRWGDALPYPSLSKLSRISGVRRDRLHRIVNRLKKKGLLVVINRRRTDGGKDRSFYDFTQLFCRIEEIMKAKSLDITNPIADDGEDTHVGKSDIPMTDIPTCPCPQNPTYPCPQNPTCKEEEIKEEEDNITTTLTSEEQEFLSLISSVEGYPFNKKRDAVFLRNLKELFPTVDILTETKKWAIYKQDKPLTKKSNPRSQLRNWLEIASKKQEGGKQNGGRIKPVAKPSATLNDWL
ncbi:hypothetical protein GFC01_00765 [Desulfofundulus thermobenzoicus]|uniref:Helix-turn-helix domain-containing protein n=1 Tax=Desulfofundulus thermobenzoicus TaxID=29376 RepID=A0A6N7ILK8_9FIRM|nr:hypothetical protein [Desulfofundulus thermobenzoicus]MQL50831.1 hypothetical protein [Desulfofundulus thermobenzoicus]